MPESGRTVPVSSSESPQAPREDRPRVVSQPRESLGLERLAESPWVRWAAILAVIFLGYQLLVVTAHMLERLLPVVLLVVFGALLAFLLAPLVKALERMGFGRTLAALTVYVAILVVVAGGASLLSVPASKQLANLVERYPEYTAQLHNALQSFDKWATDHGLPALSLGDLVTPSAFSAVQARSVLTGAVGIVSAVAGSLVNVVLVFVVGFYLLRDGDRLRRTLSGVLPERARPQYDFAVEALAFVVGGYVRAQVTMAVIIGSLAGLGCWALGVRYPIVIGLTVGLLELIPILGALLGSLIAIFIAMLQSFQLALIVAGYFLIIHFLEAYVLGPRITGVRVHLHPLVALLSMLVGVELAGLFGALFAVPLAGLLNVFIRAFYWDIRSHNPQAFGAATPQPAAASGWRRAWAQMRSRKAAPKAP